MKLNKSSVFATLGIAALTLFSSCQDEDFGYTSKEVRDAVYDRNFIAHYGDIDPNQSWDLSSAGLISRIDAAREAAENAGVTRGTGDYFNGSGETSGQGCAEETSVSNSGYTITATKSPANSFTESHDLIQWVKKRMMEGDYRLNKGDRKTNKEEFNQRFSMIATEKSFQLMPVFQGIDNTIWDLHAVIEWVDDNEPVEANKHKQVDIVLWRKSEGLTMRGERPNLMGESIQDYVFAKEDGTYRTLGELSTLSTNTLAYDSQEKKVIYPTEDQKQSDGTYKTVNKREIDIDPQGDVRFETTRLAADIQSQWVTVTGYPEKISTINFYLHVLVDNDGVNDNMTEKKFWSDGREPENTSTTGNIVVLPVQVDIKEYQDREIVLMGCETALSSKMNGGKSYSEGDVYKQDGSGKSYQMDGTEEKTKHDYGDDDMNDIVFLLIGDEVSKKLPELVNHNEISKRYFFEDLGSVVDWDFNDVVLDMKQETYQKDGKIMVRQTAKLKHRCGTTPFDLWLKNADDTYSKMNFDQLADNTGHIPGANPDQNTDQMEKTQEIVILTEREYSKDAESTYPWQPAANNVAIKVYPSTTPYKNDTPDESVNPGIWSEFKNRYQEGDGKNNVPRVFVADQSVWWTAENKTFPNIWTKPQDAITTKPEGAEPNDYSNGTIYGIGSDRSFRYPYVDGDQLILWNTPTRFDNWEPLWMSEGFMEGLENGYNTIHIEFGNCTTEFCLLVRQDYRANDYKYGEQWKQFISGYSNKVYDFTIPTTDQTLFSGEQSIKGGSIDWYRNQKTAGLSPSIGIQDNDEYDGHKYSGNDPGGYYITINKVWMTKGATQPEEPADKDFNITLGQDINRVLTDMGYNSMVSAEQLNNVKVGDKIVINMKDVANGAQIQILEMGDWKAVVGQTALNGATTFTLNVTSDNVEKIKKGIDIQGTGFTITKVYIEEGEPVDDTITGTTIPEGSVTLYDNGSVTIVDWNNHVKIEANTFNSNDVKTGDVIIIHTSGLHTNSQAGLRDKDWKAIANGKEYFDIPGDYELEVTDDILSKITNGGLIITGRYYTIEKVTLRPAAVLPTYTLTATLASGCENMGTIEISPNKSAYHTDDVVTVNAKPKAGYKFVSWSDSGDQSHQITIGEENITITATFEVDNSYVAAETTLWEGTATADGWSNQPTIELSALDNKSIGKTLHFYITNTDNSWGLEIFPSSWGTPYASFSDQNFNLADNNGAVNLIVTEAMVNGDKKFILNGDNVTCSKITLE